MSLTQCARPDLVQTTAELALSCYPKIRSKCKFEGEISSVLHSRRLKLDFQFQPGSSAAVLGRTGWVRVDLGIGRVHRLFYNSPRVAPTRWRLLSKLAIISAPGARNASRTSKADSVRRARRAGVETVDFHSD